MPPLHEGVGKCASSQDSPLGKGVVSYFLRQVWTNSLWFITAFVCVSVV